jgi:hypothetical protein
MVSFLDPSSQIKFELWKQAGQTILTTTSQIWSENQNKLLELIETRSTIHPIRPPAKSAIEMAEKSRSEIPDNDHPNLTGKPKHCAVATERNPLDHSPKKAPSSSWSPLWLWWLFKRRNSEH